MKGIKMKHTKTQGLFLARGRFYSYLLSRGFNEITIKRHIFKWTKSYEKRLNESLNSRAKRFYKRFTPEKRQNLLDEIETMNNLANSD